MSAWSARQTYDYKGAGDHTLKYMGTGKIDGGAKAIVLYVHGRRQPLPGRRRGMFGGNFNRIKNLMVRNGGALSVAGFLQLLNSRGADEAKDC